MLVCFPFIRSVSSVSEVSVVSVVAMVGLMVGLVVAMVSVVTVMTVMTVVRLVGIGWLRLGVLVASEVLVGLVAIAVGRVNNILDLGLSTVAILVITLELNGFLVLNLFSLIFDFISALELTADFSLELVLVVAIAFKFLAKFDLGAFLEFEVVLLLEFLLLFAASLNISLDLKLTSAKTLVDSTISVVVSMSMVRSMRSVTITVVRSMVRSSVTIMMAETSIVEASVVMLGALVSGAVTIIDTVLVDSTNGTELSLVVVVVGAILVDATKVIRVLSHLVWPVKGAFPVIDSILGESTEVLLVG